MIGMHQELLVYYALVVATIMGAIFGWDIRDKMMRLKERWRNWPYHDPL